ncbi:MAG: hypothetical protein KC646_01610 [Candidatus Cloacimonetes bacterium]|nr:hypothetical protein [Candidatus Cloacimonadota bacterium]
MSSLQNAIKRQLRYRLPNNEIMFGFISNLYFSTKMEFNWNPYYSFIELPDSYEDLLIMNDDKMTAGFKKLVESGDLSIFIDVLKSWDEYVDIDSVLKKARNNIKEAYTPNYISRHQNLSQKFTAFLDSNPHYQNYYDIILLPSLDPIVKLYIHKKNKNYKMGIEERSIQRAAIIALFTKTFQSLSLDVEKDQNNLIEAFHLYKANDYLQAYLHLLKIDPNILKREVHTKFLKILWVQLNNNERDRLINISSK